MVKTKHFQQTQNKCSLSSQTTYVTYNDCRYSETQHSYIFRLE